MGRAESEARCGCGRRTWVGLYTAGGVDYRASSEAAIWELPVPGKFSPFCTNAGCFGMGNLFFFLAFYDWKYLTLSLTYSAHQPLTLPNLCFQQGLDQLTSKFGTLDHIGVAFVKDLRFSLFFFCPKVLELFGKSTTRTEKTTPFLKEPTWARPKTLARLSQQCLGVSCFSCLTAIGLSMRFGWMYCGELVNCVFLPKSKLMNFEVG